MTSSTRRIPIHAGLLLLFLFLFALSVPSGSVAAQSILLVRVNAQGGQPVADATVEVAQSGTVQRRLPSDARGAARFAAMLPGLYQVRVHALGYRDHVEENVDVGLGSTTVVEIVLESAPIELEGITVSSERVRIERENTEFKTEVDETAIKLLPVTHDARDLVALTPGARPGHVWGGASFQANNYRLDGLSANHPGVGGDLIEPNVNWIDRVEVRGLGSGAEYGGFQGGLIDIVTRKGSNDFRGMVRTSLEDQALNTSNLVSTETSAEVAGRREVEGEVQGPLVRDRLFYYASAKRTRQDRFALNHLAQVSGNRTPDLERRTEEKLFGKLTWTPRPATEVDVSAAYLGTNAENWAQTGYEAPGAALRYRAPTWIVNGSWRETLGSWAVLEARVNHFGQDERQDPYQGSGVPGVQLFALSPPYQTFGNNPLSLRSAPSSTSASLAGSFRFSTGSLEHVVKVGAEYNRGHYLEERTRNGGMTWMPAGLEGFDPTRPATWYGKDWYTGTEQWIASRWGGEVHVDADVSNASLYAQSSLSLGPRVVLSPGLRWSRWQGWLTPRSGDRFRAVEDQAVDVRVGVTVDLTADGTFAAKAHWGRYHQALISQMFDRASGSDAFTNEEIWYYRGEAFGDPGRVVTPEERDALAARGLFTKESEIVLNETGPVRDYHQPYVDEWLVGLEKRAGRWVKLELLYTQRHNHDMVALVDLNRATNYTLFSPVKGGGLKQVWLPNDVLMARMRCKAAGTCPGIPDVPLLSLADTALLTWSPDYVLTTAPDGRRDFGQLQFTVEVNRPSWGGSFSFVHTSLKGNLDNVSGYTDPSGYGAGPYVHVNEAQDDYGFLENSADFEGKISMWGELPGSLEGGLFWTYRSGDHYSRKFRLTGTGLYTYGVPTGVYIPIPGHPHYDYSDLDYHFFAPLEGQDVFVGERGDQEMEARANLDLHLERAFPLLGRRTSLSLDVFNVTGSRAVTGIQQMSNYGTNPLGVVWNHQAADLYYRSPLQRVPPRTVRLAVEVGF